MVIDTSRDSARPVAAEMLVRGVLLAGGCTIAQLLLMAALAGAGLGGIALLALPLLVGWTLIAATALPAQIVAAIRGRPIVPGVLGVRLRTLLLAGVPVWALGYWFDDVPGGMMEGGMIVMPFFLLYCFAASFLAALLPVMAVRFAPPV